MNPKDIKIGMRFQTCRGAAQRYQAEILPWSCIGKCEEPCCKVIHTITSIHPDFESIIYIEPTIEGIYKSKQLKTNWVREIIEVQLEPEEIQSFNRLSFLLKR
jgi:hypothetical protein